MMGWSARRSGVHTATLVAAVASLLAVLTPAASARSSDHGASFAVRCDFSHRAPDDPIVHPGMPGMAHSHDFFGNTSTSADSTHDSLLGQETTCTRPEDTAAYWLPTVSWGGVEVDSNRAVFYYRAGGKDHKKVKPFPAGLKIIAGNEKRVTWRCGRLDNGGGSQNPPSGCDNGELGVRVIFPDCLDVARNGEPLLDNERDHRSHMAYSRRIDGRVRCPRSHPRPVPVLTMNVTFDLPEPSGNVTLSSGGASTMHADFFNAWDQEELDRLVVNCINKVPPSKPRPDDCQANPPPPA
jgi:hypothetical protein